MSITSSSLPAPVHFECVRGDTFQRTIYFDLVDEDEVVTPLPLTGVTIRAQIKNEVDGPVLHTMTNTSGITIVQDGEIDLEISATIMRTMPVKVMVMDIEFTDGSIVTTWAGGTFKVTADTTTP